MTTYKHKARGVPGGYQLKAGTLAQLIGLADIRKTVGRGDGGIGTLVGCVDSAGVNQGTTGILAAETFYANGTLSAAGAYNATGVIYGAGLYATEASRNNTTAAEGDIVSGHSVTLLGVTTAGTLDMALWQLKTDSVLIAAISGTIIKDLEVITATSGATHVDGTYSPGGTYDEGKAYQEAQDKAAVFMEVNNILVGVNLLGYAGLYREPDQDGYSALAAGYGAGGGTIGHLAAAKINDPTYGTLVLTDYQLKTDSVLISAISANIVKLGEAITATTPPTHVDGIYGGGGWTFGDDDPTQVLTTAAAPGTLNLTLYTLTSTVVSTIDAAKADILTTRTLYTVTGTFDEAARNVDPGIANVISPTAYKIQNVSLVGTLGAAPATPTLTFVDSADGTGGVATIIGSTTGSTNYVYTMPLTGGVWTLKGTRTGNGTVTLSLAVGGYAAYVLSSKNGAYSASSSIAVTVTDATDAAGRVQQICDALVALLATADTAGAFARTLSTDRAYTTDLTLQAPVGALSVLAVPAFTQRRRTSNGTYRRDVVVEILVRTHLDADSTIDQDTTDDGLYLVEQIDDYLAHPDNQTLTLPDGELAIYVEPTDMRAEADIRADAGAMWMREHLTHLRQVTGLVRVAYCVDVAY